MVGPYAMTLAPYMAVKPLDAVSLETASIGGKQKERTFSYKAINQSVTKTLTSIKNTKKEKEHNTESSCEKSPNTITEIS